MENAVKETTNILLTLPCDLNEKLRREAAAQRRKRHAQIVFILEKFLNRRRAARRKPYDYQQFTRLVAVRARSAANENDLPRIRGRN